MEEHGWIEPLPDDEMDAHHEITSDYEPSLDESVFGSLTSTINEHVWEYGRRYHTYRIGRYPLPNDDDEFKREYLRHVMLKHLLNNELYLAPIGNNPQKIIDLGTGFGDWAMDVGEKHPSARVIGVDLSPIQPKWVPSNVEFVVDDIEDEWVHDKDFDFVHMRWVGTTLKDNDKVFRSIFENLRPGGWVESQDIFPNIGCDDGTVPADWPPRRFYDTCDQVFSSTYGFDIKFVEHLPQDLERIGFVNVQRKVYHIPLGEWAKDANLRVIGGFLKEIFLDLVAVMATKPFIEAGLDRDDIDELVHSTRAAVNNKRFHAYIPVHFVWAQKPFTA